MTKGASELVQVTQLVRGLGLAPVFPVSTITLSDYTEPSRLGSWYSVKYSIKKQRQFLAIAKVHPEECPLTSKFMPSPLSIPPSKEKVSRPPSEHIVHGLRVLLGISTFSTRGNHLKKSKLWS
jgi:hypothetical protein